MGGAGKHLILVALLAVLVVAAGISAKTLTVGVVQTVIENKLDENRAKLTGFIDQAKQRGCRLVIFPEGALYWSDISSDNPTKAELDAAIAAIGRHARSAGVYTIFGVSYKLTDDGRYHNRGVAFDPNGRRLLFCRKNMDVPRRFFVDGVPCNLSICSDRGYLEHSDLPCIAQGSQVIIDISGGHGGDDGRPDLRWIRYRPWAARTGAYVIVSNPVHNNTDFMGHCPWGGGSAVIRPDGSIQARRAHQRDVMIVAEIDTDLATRAEAARRWNNPVMRDFWQAGKELLEQGTITPAPDIAPLTSAQRSLTIAAAQMACSSRVQDNTKRTLLHIEKAAEQGADVVAFPELAVTGPRSEDVAAASARVLEDALRRIRAAAKENGICVIVGAPAYNDGLRRNCAFVIGEDGIVKTRYAQLATKRADLFRPGSSARDMWFTVKGVHAIVTIGDDSDWVEIADLAAARGMILHFHLSCESDPTAEDAVLRQQRNLLFLRYAKFGLVVNAADPSDLPRPSSPASGISMIVSREGGHNRPAPGGLDYYLPYQTSIVSSAAAAETIIFATRRTQQANDLDLNRSWRNRNRKARDECGWHEWIRYGASLIGGN
jgi:predicted amidohydrolase